jgi:hypothetical protein
MIIYQIFLLQFLSKYHLLQELFSHQEKIFIRSLIYFHPFLLLRKNPNLIRYQ